MRRLRELGVTALELMPVAEFPGDRGWGYDGVDLFAPHHVYGGPWGLQRLVDAAHAAGLGVILDVGYNHLGPSGNYLRAFSPDYFTSRHKTPWGAAINYDGPNSEPVRRFVLDDVAQWIGAYHLDGLRLDATHEIQDDSRPRPRRRGRLVFALGGRDPEQLRASAQAPSTIGITFERQPPRS